MYAPICEWPISTLVHNFFFNCTLTGKSRPGEKYASKEGTNVISSASVIGSTPDNIEGDAIEEDVAMGVEDTVLDGQFIAGVEDGVTGTMAGVENTESNTHGLLDGVSEVEAMVLEDQVPTTGVDNI